MQGRSDKFLGARILLYLAVIIGGSEMANLAMNNGDAGTLAIALVLAVATWRVIGAVERLVLPREEIR